MNRSLSVEEAIEEIRLGRQIILVDDEDRENEGDLCMAAELCTAADINFMARHGRGLICLTLTREQIERLHLPKMTERNQARYQTNFHVSIEAREGVTTGISAADRARTIAAAVAKDARPDDLVSPGHMFPICAVDGGVLVRAGQTEGSSDLAKLAGLSPSGVICEIIRDDGKMARRPDLEEFGKRHDLGILTIAQLIEYRLQREPQLREVARVVVMPEGVGAEFKLSIFRSSLTSTRYIALSHGDLSSSDVLVRMHRANALVDMIGVGPRKGRIRIALTKIVEHGVGVLVCVIPEDLGLENQYSSVDKRHLLSGPLEDDAPKLREFGLGAQVLVSLGLSRIRLLTDNPKRIAGLGGFGLEVVECVSMKDCC